MRIHVLWHTNEKAHVEPLMRAEEALRRLGYNLTFSETRQILNVDDGADAVLVHQHIMCDELLAHGKPVIILERIDGAQLGISRQWLHYDQVVAVVKGYAFRDPELNNTTRGRYQAKLLAEAGVKATGDSMALSGLPQPQLTANQLAKIRVGYGFAAYDFLLHLHQDVDWEAERSVPAMFAGWVDYSGSEIETHRRDCIRIIERLGGVALTGRTLNLEQYRAKLDKSRAAVSPWGWGEACYRDYEAILRGCVLIKPPSAHVKAWPDIFGDGFPGYPCKADWSDLEEAIRLAGEARDYGMVREELKEARRRVLNSWQPDAIAIHMAGIFDQVL